MVLAPDIVCLCIISIILIADVLVFIKCETYKTGTSILISVCLFSDLSARFIQLCVRDNRNKQQVMLSNYQEYFHDLT